MAKSNGYYKKKSLWGGEYYTNQDPGVLADVFAAQWIPEVTQWLGIEFPSYDYTTNLAKVIRPILEDSTGFLETLSDGELEALLSDYTTSDGFVNIEDFKKDLANLSQYSIDMPEVPDYQAAYDQTEQLRLAELERLSENTARQTELFENQLQENQMMFDEYRSNILQNQYQQNAQLMGSVDSAMSKARRNALEAGASAGLRMAENINTTLALQNKQSQTSLETSNQLAQQLLNQRQAAAGIRNDYNSMLTQADSAKTEANRYYDSYQDTVKNRLDSDYYNKYDDWSRQFGTSSLGNRYKGYLEQNQSVKKNSQYNN